jgi:hypothetical protein
MLTHGGSAPTLHCDRQSLCENAGADRIRWSRLSLSR